MLSSKKQLRKTIRSRRKDTIYDV